MRRLSMTLLAALAATALTLGTCSAAEPVGGGAQVVQGAVTEQFGFALASDGSVRSSATLPVSVTRTREDGIEFVTIAPLR